ncbi:MAG TPA: crotonase [Deltaproteobacteria bacterium]|nr:MAG: crotonase [Deltaproteobacteria bacterium GWA2_65_63]OGP26809.1 MAG: crotonase [Deltaproteobacteria bacterium GWB2_65_81]OGP39681.1 MAG: crotonase [Deltaproteobacteria bacterium GWC2_66_88]OGP77369.1 MAG: crotonase [Deltaproteobacteria bacterium RBG_16_66_15]HAM32740.1 crotonase [Deltaproteobacteria bacterium]
MAYENLLVDVSERIATVTFNRPKSLNALNPPTVRELGTAMEEISSREDVGVVLLTGSGEKAFIAGADISEMKAFTTMQALDFALLGQGVLSFIERMPQPVIGAINGFALGGGCEVAMACDLLVASDTARFGQPEVNLGIIPGYGGTQRLPRLVGRNLAKELVLTGEMISAQRAYEIGLVNKVVPAAELMNAAREIAKKILSRGPVAVRTAKMAMNRGLDLDLGNACALEASLFAAGFSTADRQEGIAAFLEKRKPAFTGR